MRKTLMALAAAATLVVSAVAAPAPAHAQRGVGAGIAAGVIGGAIVGGALAGPRYYGPGYGYYGGPAYIADPGYYGGCYWQRQRFFDYIGRRVKPAEVPWELMRVAMASVARLAVVHMQDVLGLGAEARMNYPAKTKGNWRWRMRDGLLTPGLADRLRRLTEVHGRA
jgi:hypothetical protein